MLRGKKVSTFEQNSDSVRSNVFESFRMVDAISKVTLSVIVERSARLQRRRAAAPRAAQGNTL